MADDDKVKISCSHCKASFLVPGPAEGKKFRCPKCKEIFSAAGPSNTTRTGRAGPSTRSIPKQVEDEDASADRKPTRRELAQKKREEEAAARAKRMKVVIPIVAAVALLGGGVAAFFWWKSAQAEEAAQKEHDRIKAADKKVEETLASARTLIASKSFKEAALALDDAVASESKHKWEAQVVRGRAKVGLRDFAGAITDFDAALKAQPDLVSDWEAHYYRGAALLANRQETDAVEELQTASRCEHSPPEASQFAGALADSFGEKRKAIDAAQTNAALLPVAPAGLPPLDLGAFDVALVPDAWDRPGWRLKGSTDAAAIVKDYRPEDFPIALLVLRDDTPFGAAVPALRKLAEKGFKKVAFAVKSGEGLTIAVAGLSATDPGGSNQQAGSARVQVVEGGKEPSVSGDVTLSVAAFARPSELAAALSACARSKAKPTIWLDPGSQDDGALAAALLWLARHQEPDGHWGVTTFNQQCTGDACHGGGDSQNDLGVTALAALAFLEAGIAPGDKRWPGFGRAVDAALAWLAKAQQPDGSVVAPGAKNAVFQHVFAALTFVQAARAGGSAWKEPAQKAVAWLEGAIGEKAWGYVPGDAGGDTSITGWGLVALAAARAAGLTVGTAPFDKAIAWADARTNDTDLDVSYRPKQYKPQYAGRSQFPAMAAQALVIRLLVAGDTSGGKSKAYASLLAKALPQGGDKSTWDYYYWHVGTPATWLLDGAANGPYWKAWSKALAGAVAPSQCSGEECSAGSWQDEDPWSKLAGRVYCTAINAMTLSVLTGRDTLYRGLKLGK